MSENATGFDTVDLAPKDANVTNGTSSTAPGFVSAGNLDLLLLEVKLVLSALGIIYLGAHAALRRPPSAAPAKSKKAGQTGKGHRDEEDEERVTQGLMPSDAIMFPLLAGIMLVGLYYLIQWLKDPAILNKILRWYMSAMSIASLLTLYAHGMELATSVVFPRYWRGRDGVVRKVNQKTKAVAICDDAGNRREGAASTPNPLPGPFALLVRSAKARKAAWELRGLLTRQWTAKIYAHGVGEEKGKIKFAHVMALFLSLATAIVYFSTSSTFLSNMLGYGMCYGSFLIISPTDFLTSCLVLGGLFCYDIVMVFYTPYMVTVATTLDVPIKLTFEVASRKSILGLGDIVIPGMVIGWALRFDLWLHYLRKVKYEATDLTLVEKDAASGAIVTRKESKHKEVKARYVNVKGSWGERLWVRGAMFASRPEQLPVEIAAAQFPKVYFYASMAGYGAGMLVTLAMLMVFSRGQPALLYLVPGVLGALGATAVVRGEFKALWRYTEDGSIDTKDVVVELDASGKATKTIGKLEKGIVNTTKDKDKDKDKDKEEEKDAKTGNDEKDGQKAVSKNVEAGKELVAEGADGRKEHPKKDHRVFMISIDALSEDEDDEDE